MQNPFRHHGPDDRDRERDEHRWEARDQRFDENRSWGYGGGDGGRSAEAYGSRQSDEDRYRAQARGDRDYGYGRPAYSADYGRQRDDWYGQASPRHEEGRYGRRDFAHNDLGEANRADYRRSQAYGDRDSHGPTYGSRSDHRGYASQGYAPGAQIWREGGMQGGSSRSQRDYEPDYLHWREQQMSNFDRDYDDWRHERRQKFSADFDTWRQNRPRTEASGEHRTPAANPIVGDVSDGGTGNAHDAKKR